MAVVTPIFPERRGASVQERIEIIERSIASIEAQMREAWPSSETFRSLSIRLGAARRRLAMLTEADR